MTFSFADCTTVFFFLSNNYASFTAARSEGKKNPKPNAASARDCLAWMQHSCSFFIFEHALFMFCRTAGTRRLKRCEVVRARWQMDTGCVLSGCRKLKTVFITFRARVRTRARCCTIAAPAQPCIAGPRARRRRRRRRRKCQDYMKA